MPPKPARRRATVWKGPVEVWQSPARRHLVEIRFNEVRHDITGRQHDVIGLDDMAAIKRHENAVASSVVTSRFSIE